MKIFNKTSQKGLTLLEILVALAIIGAAAGGWAAYVSSSADENKSELLGKQIAQFGAAAKLYINDHYGDISIAQKAAGTPVTITANALKNAGYLDTGFEAKNVYGQTMCAIVRQPQDGKLEGLVVTEGGEKIDDLNLATIANSIGYEGGAIYSTDPDTMKGSMGGWSLAKSLFANSNQSCDGSASAVALEDGHPVAALWFNEISQSGGYLHRNKIEGAPELNQMQTDLDMAGHNINNAGIINAKNINASENATINGTLTAGKIKVTDVVTAGAACETGMLARDAEGKILDCQNGKWKKTASGSFGGYYTRTSYRGNTGNSINPVTGTAGTCAPGTSPYLFMSQSFTRTGNGLGDGYVHYTGYTSYYICIGVN